MKALFLNPVAIVCYGAIAFGIITSAPWISALAMAALFGTLVFQTIRKGTRYKHISEFTHQGQALLRPFRAVKADIEKLIALGKKNAVVSTIGKEALEVIDPLIKHAEKLVESHEFLTQMLKIRGSANSELERQKKQLATAEGHMKESLEKSIELREAEIKKYDDIQFAADALARELKSAEIELLEIRARLAKPTAGSLTDDLDTEDLRGMVNRLKTLNTSFDEAEQMMEERIK